MSSPLIRLASTVFLSVFAVATASATPPETLATKAGCLACHSKDKKLFGPPFHEVAAKYKGDAKAPPKLAAHVRSGSKGIWGNKAIMIPVTTKQIGDADLATVIDWVLMQ